MVLRGRGLVEVGQLKTYCRIPWNPPMTKVPKHRVHGWINLEYLGISSLTTSIFSFSILLLCSLLLPNMPSKLTFVNFGICFPIQLLHWESREHMFNFNWIHNVFKRTRHIYLDSSNEFLSDMRRFRIITRLKHIKLIDIPTMSMRYWMRPWMSQILGIFPLHCLLDVVMTKSLFNICTYGYMLLRFNEHLM